MKILILFLLLTLSLSAKCQIDTFNCKVQGSGENQLILPLDFTIETGEDGKITVRGTTDRTVIEYFVTDTIGVELDGQERYVEMHTDNGMTLGFLYDTYQGDEYLFVAGFFGAGKEEYYTTCRDELVR